MWNLYVVSVQHWIITRGLCCSDNPDLSQQVEEDIWTFIGRLSHNEGVIKSKLIAALKCCLWHLETNLKWNKVCLSVTRVVFYTH